MKRSTRPTDMADLCKLEPYRISKRCKEHRGYIFIGTFEECRAEHTRTKAADEDFQGKKRDRFFKCSCLFQISRIKLHSIINEIEGAGHE